MYVVLNNSFSNLTIFSFFDLIAISWLEAVPE